MRSLLLCVVMLLPACAATSTVQHSAAVPIATGLLKTLKSDSSVVTGGLVWTDTAKVGTPCAIYDDWVRIDAADGVIWISRESVTYVQLLPRAD